MVTRRKGISGLGISRKAALRKWQLDRIGWLDMAGGHSALILITDVSWDKLYNMCKP